MANSNFSSTAAFLWSIADLLRGDFKQSQYGRIILPFTLLRRLECVLEKSKAQVLTTYDEIEEMGLAAEAKKQMQHRLLPASAGLNFYNTSPMDLNKLGENDIADDLEQYLRSFSDNACEIFEHFDFFKTIEKLAEANLLYKITKAFAQTNLHPKSISNHDMGLVFEELIRRFAESSNESAGEHFTPRDLVRLTTSMLFANEDQQFSQASLVRSIYDPTAGTGGFLSAGMEYVRELNPDAALSPFGQELNPESYAICKADMLIKGQKVDQIKLGNTLSQDQLPHDRFDYMLSNPPFGVDWKKIQQAIVDEHQQQGAEGRFAAGLPRVSDGSLLFLLHLISKMHPQRTAEPLEDNGSRIGIILNGSPLFTGGAGSGESDIRRYILEQDLLEAIVALPTDMFYNTGIATYVWILSNQKSAARQGKVQLINAAKERPKSGGRGRSAGGESTAAGDDIFYQPMRKSLGNKRRELTEDSIKLLVNTYRQFEETTFSKIFDNQAFGYRRITIERPLRLALYPTDPARLQTLQADPAWSKWHPDAQQATLTALRNWPEAKLLARDAFLSQLTAALRPVKLSAAQQKLLVKHLAEVDQQAQPCLLQSGKNKGHPEANPELRDYENVPLSEPIEAYFAREVQPHVADAWIDLNKTDPQDGQVGIVGYEIPFNRHFYVYQPPRPLSDIDAELDAVSQEIMTLLKEVHG